MRVLDLFTGIGGLAYPAHRLGYEHSAFCEINTDCHKILRRHFPGVEIIEDVKEISKARYGFQPDVICGGFPCQDVSVAGRRAGLAGERSGLWFEALRIVTDYKPRIVVIENVPGLLSSNGGADFAVVLRGLVECGYGVAWRVFDSQYFGVAQRRRRVFIVASLGSGRAAEILFEREGGGWNSAPSRETGEKVAGTFNARTTAGGGFGTDFECDGGLQVAGQYRLAAFGEYADDGTASTLKQRDYKDATDLIVQPNVTHALRGEGFDASEDGTGRGTPLVAYSIRSANTSSNGWGIQKEASHTLDGASPHCVAFQPGNLTRRAGAEPSENVFPTLTATQGSQFQHIAGQFGVRRLTPRECERLQGFPDQWTRYGDDGKEISDSARYRMLGNAITVNVGEWIFRRILQVYT